MDSPPRYDPEAKDSFRHKPLNHAIPSIRLIKIHRNRTSEGLIQCDVRITSTKDRYVCLSYVWGEPGDGQWILLNGAKFWVRQNLWDFVAAARTVSKLTDCWIWIDAICINQMDIKERQHQVQQMGQIYAGAVEVCSWFGTNKTISQFLADSQECYEYERVFGQSINRFSDPVACDDLSASPYWRRAWVRKCTKKMIMFY